MRAVKAPPTEAWHARDAQEVVAALGSSEAGLSNAEASARLSQFGPNALSRAGGPGLVRLMWRQIANPISYLLLGSAVIAIALGKLVDGLVVLGAVVVNAVIGFLQEFRAGRAIEALSQMVPDAATVTRDGRSTSIPATDLVPGDLVLLASGDRVPADLRLIQSRNLQIQEAALTGESVASAKEPRPLSEATPLADRSNMAFGGTLVGSGTGKGVVVATGNQTELGRISDLLRETVELQTPLTRALASVGKMLTVVVLVVALALLAIGLLRGYPLADGMMVAITLAVGTIPEGLPAIITIALAIGVQRMAARNAVVRKLPSVETLGSTTVICSDKTGTLTRNEMTVQALLTPAGIYELSGVGYSPHGSFASANGPIEHRDLPQDLRALLDAAALCSDATVRSEGGAWAVSGDPTEAALVVAAMKAQTDVERLRRTHPRLDAIPFESEHQFMATLHAVDGPGRAVLIKGAPEVVLRRCRLEPGQVEREHEKLSRLTSRGLRVLAVGRKQVEAERTLLELEDASGDFELLGYEAMMDPPRPEAIEAVRTCHRAGITVKMITGDHLGTAEAIGRQLGLLDAREHGLSGAQLAETDEARLPEVAHSTHVFARVAPEHKLRLVKALQADRQVVAMTGDGVNDAPALKQANVGVAMGITGTAVSKEAADMVLADDNFATIAAAVEEGRRIYDNLVKSLAFVLPTNLGIGLLLIVSVAFFPVLVIGGADVPLMPMHPTQILWLNMVTTVALSLPLALEKSEPDSMQRPPRAPDAPVLGRGVWLRTLLVAALMAGGAVALFLWEYWRDVAVEGHVVALEEAQTMAVTTVVFFQIFYLFNCRSLRGSVLKLGLFSNRSALIGSALLLVLHAGFIYLPFMHAVFGTAPLTPGALGRAAVVAAIVMPVVALEKTLRRRREHRRPTRIARMKASHAT